MTPESAFLASAVVLTGSILQGAVGIGLGLLSAPLLVLIDPGLVPGPLLFASLLLTTLMALRDRRSVDLFGLQWSLVGRVPGALAGALLVGAVSQAQLGLGIGLFVLVGVGLAAWGPHVMPTRWTLFGVGALSGFMGTATSIGGPPMALLYQHQEGPRLRGTLSVFFVLGAIMSLAFLASVGRFGRQEMLISLVLVPGIVAGFFVSGRLTALVDRGNTRSAILAVSAAAGLAVIARQLV